MISPGFAASSRTSSWSRRSPQGSMRITGPVFSLRIASTASITGSGFITIPGPPPNGMSSTWRCRSWVKSRRSCACSCTTPRSIARPITPCAKTGPNMPGKMVTTSNRINRSIPRVLVLEQRVRDHHAAAGDVDLDAGVLRRGDEVLNRAFAADPHIVGGALEDLLDHAEAPAVLGHRGEPYDLPVIEAPGFDGPHRLVRQLEVPASEQLGQGSAVDAVELDHQPWLAFAAPLDLAVASVEQDVGTGVKPVGEICQGQDLDSSVQSVRSHHLPNTNHACGSPPLRRLRGAPCRCSNAGLARSTKTRLRSFSDATRTSVRNASMLRPALPMKRPMSSSASFTLMATVPPPRSNASTVTSSGFSASDFATYSTSAR